MAMSISKPLPSTVTLLATCLLIHMLKRSFIMFENVSFTEMSFMLINNSMKRSLFFNFDISIYVFMDKFKYIFKTVILLDLANVSVVPFGGNFTR